MIDDPTARPDDTATGLVWSGDEAPRSARFGDVYFSIDDGLAESRAVFLEGCGLPGGWSDRRDFTVAELGFGTGLNIVALIDLWRREGRDGGRLHVFSIEAWPLTAQEAGRALAAWPEQADIVAALLAAWPEGTPGFHRIDLPMFSVTIDLAVGDAAWALEQWSGRADAWFLDGFSPAVNPGMWSPEVMALIAARSAPGARVATFTVAGAVRRGLADNGFAVDKRPGHGRKRERLEARLTDAPAPRPVPVSAPSTVAVIGGGIAGASVVQALKTAGVETVLIEGDRPGAGASGFPAALVTPRLDAGDALIAGLHVQALERAGALYAATPDAVIAQGVLQLEQAPRDAGRFDKIAVQPLWAADQMTRLDAAAASARLGEDLEVGALLMDAALTVRPRAVLADWLSIVPRVVGQATTLEHSGDRWQVLDENGTVLAEVDRVVICAGWGVSALIADLPLRPVRGQANWIDDVHAPATAWGGYIAPTGTGLLFGATHDRDDITTEVRAADTARNLETLVARLPRVAGSLDPARVSSRAAVRATTPDRLPICGAVPGTEGLYCLGGLGSRGFCLAPLLGEHLAATIARTPSPLPAAFADRLRPDRFARS